MGILVEHFLPFVPHPFMNWWHQLNTDTNLPLNQKAEKNIKGGPMKLLATFEKPGRTTARNREHRIHHSGSSRCMIRQHRFQTKAGFNRTPERTAGNWSPGESTKCRGARRSRGFGLRSESRGGTPSGSGPENWSGGSKRCHWIRIAEM